MRGSCVKNAAVLRAAAAMAASTAATAGAEGTAAAAAAAAAAAGGRLVPRCVNCILVARYRWKRRTMLRTC